MRLKQRMFNRILIPTDGSDAVMPAVKMALDLAKTYDATLHALFIVDQPPSVTGTGEGFTGIDNLLNELEEEGRHATDTIADQAEDSNVEIKSSVQRGNPHDDILAYANEYAIDLIVIGTHGRTGVKRALLGSVTEDVVRHSEIPVLTVHRKPEE
jgi:nucleotide-binding universal stress UspA family protein